MAFVCRNPFLKLPVISSINTVSSVLAKNKFFLKVVADFKSQMEVLQIAHILLKIHLEMLFIKDEICCSELK